MRLLICLVIITFGSNTLLWANKTLKFGVFSYSSKSSTQQQYQPVIDYLNDHLKGNKVELVVLDRDSFDQALQRNNLDIISTNPSHFEVVRHNNMFIRTIATTKRMRNKISTDTFGGVIFTRADNNAINTIKDLSSRSIASMDIKSLGGYQAPLFELLEKGIDIKNNLSTRTIHDDVIDAVMSGTHDAGFIRTGMIESEIEKGRLKADAIKVINAQNMPHYPFMLSTRLYPEWPISILPNMDDKTAKELTVLFLAFGEESNKSGAISGFSLPQNYTSVEFLAKSLGLPPYDRLADVTIEQIYQQYAKEIFFLLCFIVLLIMVVVIIIRLNIRVRTSEERFKLAMEGTQDGLFDWNMLDNTMFHSKQFETMLGYDGTELPQTLDAWKQLLHPDDMEGAYKTVSEYLKTKGNYVSVFRMKAKDGSWRWIEGRGKALFNAKGVPTRFIGFNTDITDKKEHEKQLLVQTKHAQMGEMIGMIAHQWRQPLSAISATASSLQVKQILQKMDEQSLENGLNDIINLTQHLSKTINDFRDFFKEDKKKTEIRLDQVVEEALKLMESVFLAKGIALSKHYLCDEKIVTYVNELKQVLLNILKNAQDVIEEKNISNPMISIKTYQENGKYCISIEDNAGGIPESIMDKIFEPYYTTKSSLNGTGLGLYMSKTIVDDHCHGSLEAKNINNGAVFIISLNKSVD